MRTTKSGPEPGDARQGKYPIVVTAHRGFSGENPREHTGLLSARRSRPAPTWSSSTSTSPGQRSRRDPRRHPGADDKRQGTSREDIAELKGLDAGSWFNSRSPGERIPTLAEVLEIVRNRILVNIELKKGKNFPYTMEALADRTLAVVEKAE